MMIFFVAAMAKKADTVKNHDEKGYTMDDALHIAEDILGVLKEKEYNPGAFVHGLLFTLEFTQQTYNIPPQQLAGVKRDCRRYVQALSEMAAKKEGVSSK